ncbi:MAG TPA: hypothetical protein DCY07_05520 [Rhodospirillaceae bacterium]|nr:hypothetical protein [Rhodospirillaceae bacterium]
MTQQQTISLELSAVIVSLADGTPHVAVTGDLALPSGPLEVQHKKLEQALRVWVTKHSGLQLGYVEQLYTFADRDRETDGRRIISIGYLALAQDLGDVPAVDWYKFFPWEDHRADGADKLTAHIQKNLNAWKNDAPDAATKRVRAARIDVNFPKNPRDWNEELVLQRYELLWEAGLIDEAARAGKKGAKPIAAGLPMKHDHRRILATAIARLRAKIKYRPVVFELLPPQFTLLQLQNTVEALAGLRLHKQNFRRLVLSQGLVEETKAQTTLNKGRPAKLFSFRRELLQARAVAGTKLPRGG